MVLAGSVEFCFLFMSNPLVSLLRVKGFMFATGLLLATVDETARDCQVLIQDRTLELDRDKWLMQLHYKWSAVEEDDESNQVCVTAIRHLHTCSCPLVLRAIVCWWCITRTYSQETQVLAWFSTLGTSQVHPLQNPNPHFDVGSVERKDFHAWKILIKLSSKKKF